MARDDNKLKHLEFVQLTIIRMAANSFLLKAWTVALVSGIFAIASKDNNNFAILAYMPVAIFWLLDAYYLRQERLFREVYKDVSKKNESNIDFSMNTKPFDKNVSPWVVIMFSRTQWIFYIGLLAVVYAVNKSVLNG
jgi:hypothetical protein